MELTVDDLCHVHEAVYRARTRWYNIGLQLSVPVDTLDSIEQEKGDGGDHLCNVLKWWLKRGGATWGALSDALKSPTVEEHQLAKTLDDIARVQGQLQTSTESTSRLSTQDAVTTTRSRITQLEKSYSTLVTTTQKVVRQRAPGIDEFRTAITLLPSSVKIEQEHYLQDHIKYIYRAESIDEIFGHLNLHVWGYLNFGLLECIVAEYGDPTTKEMMEGYKASVQSFRKDTLLHVFLEAQPEGKCPEISPSLKKHLQEVRFQYRSLSLTSSLEEVECIRLKLARELALPDFVVELARIEFGSVSIVWVLPSSLTAILMDKIENESFQFIQWADVVEVAIAGTRIYPPGSPTPVCIPPIAGSVSTSAESGTSSYPVTRQEDLSESPLPKSPPDLPESSSLVRREELPEDQKFDIILALLNCGVPHIAQDIFRYLDVQSLLRAQCVCMLWYDHLLSAAVWKELIIKMVKSNKIWKKVSEKRGWEKYLQQGAPSESTEFFHQLYQDIVRDVQKLNSNWRSGKYTISRIHCGSPVRCLQYDREKIVSGHDDGSVKMWETTTLQSMKILECHKMVVMTLQYDSKVLITGSYDHTVRVWDIETGEELNKLVHHQKQVQTLKFQGNTLVTGSYDKTLAVWDMKSPTDIKLRRVLNGDWIFWAVELDEKYIYGSHFGDIKVWDRFTLGLAHTLKGHSGPISGLQSVGDVLVSGADDKTIMIWDVESARSLRVLQGHTDTIWCIGVDDKVIVSGSKDETIRVWDLKAALDPGSSEESLCLATLKEHSNIVFGLQFDDFKIISGSKDMSIIVWNFLDPVPPGHAMRS